MHEAAAGRRPPQINHEQGRQFTTAPALDSRGSAGVPRIWRSVASRLCQIEEHRPSRHGAPKTRLNALMALATRAVDHRPALNSFAPFGIRLSSSAGDRRAPGAGIGGCSGLGCAQRNPVAHPKDSPMSSTFDTVVNIITETCDIPRENIKPESHAINDLGIDSLDFLDIAFAIDKTFGIKMPLEQWTQDVNEGRATTEQYFVLQNLCAKIDELVAAKGLSSHAT
jgi:acyl carrier protein